MTALRVYGQTPRGARWGYFRRFDLRRAAALFAANAELLGTIGGA